jgi:putative hemolysin
MDFSALGAMWPRLVTMAALILVSAFFAGSETSLFSLGRAQRERLARSERASDRYIAALLRDPRRLIITILLGNELINVTFSSLAAGVASDIGGTLGKVAITLVTTGVTVPVLLLFGEITPKSIALRVAEPWARIAARPIGLFAFVITPVRVVVNAIAAIVVRILSGSAPPPAQAPIGEAEFKALVDVGSEEGELEAAERRLIHKVFEFGDRTVAEVMTPARDVYSLSYELPLARVVAEVARARHARIPIHRGRKNDIVGILYAKDLVGWGGGRLANRTLKDLIKTPMYVPNTTKCSSVFQEFRKRRNHMALVVDEYGRLVGLVTMEDLLGALFGTLHEPHEPHGPEINAPSPGELQ